MVKTVHLIAALLAALCLSSCSYSGNPAATVKQTTGVLHVYANGTDGSDTYDGTAATNTPGTLIGPKKTLAGVLVLVPYRVRHNVCVHLAGIFAEPAAFSFFRMIEDGAILLIDGGLGTTVIADDGGNPWAADIHSTSTLGLSTAGWAPDQYAGYWLQLEDGPAAGQTRTIKSHTATTIIPIRNFSIDPGTAHFRIVRPATTISSSTAYSYLTFSNHGGPAYVARTQRLHIQNLYISGSNVYWTIESADSPSMSAIVNDGSGGWGWMSFARCRYPRALHWDINPSTFADQLTPAFPAKGLSFRATDYFSMLDCYSGGVAGLYSTPTVNITRTSMQSGGIGQGSRINSLLVEGSLNAYSATANVTNYSTYTTTMIGGGAVGITLKDSSLSIGAGVDLSGSSSHAIEVNHSRLHLMGAVTGTGNGGAGVYAHSGSVVHIKHSAPPTLTGTVGDLAVSNPAAQESTWAAIDGGTPVGVAAEMTMAKEVP